MKKLFLLMLFLLTPCIANAAMPVNPSYVTADGSGTACTLESPCALDYANTNADDDDVVYLRSTGGVYPGGDAVHLGAIHPHNSGSVGHVITFSAYPGETPVISPTALHRWGIFFSGIDYIKVSGIIFTDANGGFVNIVNGNYNEITNCEFYNTTTTTPGAIYISGTSGGSNHNWFHGNTVHTFGTNGCAEGGDLIRVGSTVSGDNVSAHNTIENNIMYQAGHTFTDDFANYNVWRNNIGHNEGWKTFNGIYGTATGGSTTTLVDSTKNFETEGVAADDTVALLNNGSYYGTGIVDTVSGSTITYHVAGGETIRFANGYEYIVNTDGCNHSPAPPGTNPANGKYSHRCFALTGDYKDGGFFYTLFEGNRSGYASTNPNNNGADGISLASRGAIVRYNKFFGSAGPGILLKAAYNPLGKDNRIYNNTIYKNGRIVVSGGNPPSYASGIAQYTRDATGNSIKNNIIWDNQVSNAWNKGDHEGVYWGTIGDQTWAANVCDSNDAGLECTNSDPGLVGTDITDMTSLVKPELTITPSSPAYNKGTNLTTVHADDTGSGTELILSDSTYFQSGSEAVCGTTAKTASFGSCLSGIQGDTILVGATVGTASSTQIVDITTPSQTKGIVTISPAITRSAGDKVWLYKKSDGVQVLYGTAPDIGAYEYNPSSDKPTATIGSGSVMSIGSGATATLY